MVKFQQLSLVGILKENVVAGVVKAQLLGSKCGACLWLSVGRGFCKIRISSENS
jgi:hypothetical protein